VVFQPQIIERASTKRRQVIRDPREIAPWPVHF
jgi:hypothetical protein